VESVGAAATNLIPKIGTALNGASKLVRDLIPVIVQEIPVLIEKNLPILAEAAISIIQSLVDGISENQEMLMTTAMETITFLATSLISMLPQIVQLGLDLIVSLANGIAESLPTLIPTIVDVILKIVETLTNPNMITKLLNASVVLIVALANGLIAAVPQLIERIPVIIDNLVAGFSDFLQPVIEIGRNIVDGIKKGISEAWDNLVKWFKGLFGDLIGIAKKILGIASPSKVFKKLGAWTAEGFGIGFEDEFAHVKSDMEKALKFDDASIGINASIKRTGSENAFHNGNVGGVSIVQNIYSEAKTAADLMQEALYQQERAVLLGV
jgi:phage-related protein